MMEVRTLSEVAVVEGLSRLVDSYSLRRGRLEVQIDFWMGALASVGVPRHWMDASSIGTCCDADSSTSVYLCTTYCIPKHKKDYYHSV